jgi:hypothetical protein
MSYDTPSPDVESGKPADPDTPIEEEHLDPEAPARHPDKLDEEKR